MEQVSVCTCKLLEKRAQDPDVPISFEAASGKYFLHLSGEKTVEVKACQICGGYSKQDRKGRLGFLPSAPECGCGSVAAWAADPSLPVKYDEEMNEYSMAQGGIFYYCVICGGRMPRSKRGTFFTTPDEAEQADFLQRTRGLCTVEQVTEALGKPDWESGPISHSATHNAIYAMQDVRRQLTYSSVWPTMRVVFQEMEDGTLTRSWGGRYIKPVEQVPQQGDEPDATG